MWKLFVPPTKENTCICIIPACFYSNFKDVILSQIQWFELVLTVLGTFVYKSKDVELIHPLRVQTDMLYDTDSDQGKVCIALNELLCEIEQSCALATLTLHLWVLRARPGRLWFFHELQLCIKKWTTTFNNSLGIKIGLFRFAQLWAFWGSTRRKICMRKALAR